MWVTETDKTLNSNRPNKLTWEMFFPIKPSSKIVSLKSYLDTFYSVRDNGWFDAFNDKQSDNSILYFYILLIIFKK